MLACVVQQADHVVVVERVVRHAPDSAHSDEACGPEQPKLVRNRRFRGPDERREVANTPLSMRKRVNQAHARRIAQQPEDLRDSLNGSAAQKP